MWNRTWAGTTKRQKLMVVIGSVVVAVIAVLGIIGWLMPGNDDREVALTPPSAPREVPEETNADTGEVDGIDVPLTARGSRDVSGVKFPVSDNGMIELPVTDNPVEYAAAAVSALYTFDTKQMPFHQGWVDELSTRLTQPSPEYQGADATEDLEPGSAIIEQTDYVKWSITNRKDWQLQRATDYTPWASQEGSWVAQPLELWVEDEISAVDPKTVENADRQREMILGSEMIGDGSLTYVWVTVGIQHISKEGAVDDIEHKATLGTLVHCDPPEDGGLCGLYLTVPTPKELRSVRY